MTTWTRATSLTKKFPDDKYGFAKYLKVPGDMIQTYPLSKIEAARIINSAHHWAYHHKYRVHTNRINKLNGDVAVRITLVEKQRVRDFK